MKHYIVFIFVILLLNLFSSLKAADVYLTRGSVITVKSTDADAALLEFTAKPKIYGLSDFGKKSPMRVVTKVSNKTRKENVIAEWKKMFKLYDKKDYRKLQMGPKLIAAPVGDKTLDSIEILARKDVGKISKSLVDDFFIAAPVITEIRGDRINDKDSFVVIGKYFGQKLPKILIEYQRKGKWKYKKCKIDRIASYFYQDAQSRDNKSCMKIMSNDPADAKDVGYSKVTVLYPKLKPTDARSGYLIIDNRMGINAYKMLSLTSESFAPGDPIPIKYANLNVGGQNISPELTWSDPPADTKSFVVTCVDLFRKANSWCHWMVIDIPAATLSLPEDASSGNMPAGSVELLNTFGQNEYGGPQPPTRALHQYAFTVYALNVPTLNLKANEVLEEAELIEIMKDNIIEKATIIGTFKKDK